MSAPPRLIARTLAVTFFTVAIILSVVFTVLLVDARDRVRASEIEKLRAGDRVFNRFEAQRQREQRATVAALAENFVLKSALDGYLAAGGSEGRAAAKAQLYGTVASEVERLAAITGADIVAVVDADMRIFASAGRSAEHWAIGEPLAAPPGGELANVIVLQQRAFRLSIAPVRTGDREIGTLVIGTNLDMQYAASLSALSGAGIVITVGDRVVGSSLPDPVSQALITYGADAGGSLTLDGDEYAVDTLLASGPVRVFMLASIDRATRFAMRDALSALAMIAAWAFLLAAAASFLLARTLSDPVNGLARSIARMTGTRDFSQTLDRTGSSREVDALTDSFNDLMGSLMTAEAETRAAYVGTIRALAAALDARDPYTAGHSERVSTTSVVIARQMRLPESEVAVIRLGALLHDIGKIGIADEILQKPTALTGEEFDQIRRHPTLGARILRLVSFLEPHLPIVELHHERPDGAGYPFGLRGDEIPLAARIVHVADAFDAITTARAYRPARPVAAALEELRRFAGTQFDVASVNALCDARPEDAHRPLAQEPDAVGV